MSSNNVNSFVHFIAHLRDFIDVSRGEGSSAFVERFGDLSLELFGLQFAHNAAYRRFCEARGVTPGTVEDWKRIPAIPTSAFKDLELTSLAKVDRTAVFCSSGTTEQRPSRNFHNAQSLAVYEASLLPWFARHALADRISAGGGCQVVEKIRVVGLTPAANEAPHSSLVHMFETIRREYGAPDSVFLGNVQRFKNAESELPDKLGDSNAERIGTLRYTRQPREAGAHGWTIDLGMARGILEEASARKEPVMLLGTAFSFVHLLDYLAEHEVKFHLPQGSRVLETGGYKGRSREMPKGELHSMFTRRLGIPTSHILCEYGMSELSSQAYDRRVGLAFGARTTRPRFRFPPWARAQIVSPETGREVAECETGLLRTFDLANVFSVMAIQTEDLAVKRTNDFELLGRAVLAEPRGCSLTAL